MVCLGLVWLNKIKWVWNGLVISEDWKSKSEPDRKGKKEDLGVGIKTKKK